MPVACALWYLLVMAVRLFISYAHEDEEHRKSLERHLAILRRQDRIDVWHDRRIAPGAAWGSEIDRHLEQADITLLLVSASFLASDYCWDVEMEQAIARHDRGEGIVVPIIVMECDWRQAPFARLQALPRDGKPVTSWKWADEAWSDVARGVRHLVDSVATRVSERL
jgi:hypothetical protein